MHDIESDLLYGQKIYCLWACVCIFQPRNFTDWGGEGVNACILFYAVCVLMHNYIYAVGVMCAFISSSCCGVGAYIL